MTRTTGAEVILRRSKVVARPSNSRNPQRGGPRRVPFCVLSTGEGGDSLRDMYIGLGVFAVLAVVCVFAGAAAMKRRREYGGGDGDGEMGEAEFRKYEGFDK